VGSLLIFLAVMQDHVVSRFFLGSFSVALYALLVWSNAKLPFLIAPWLFHKDRTGRTLLVGTIEGAERLGGWLERKASLELSVRGLINTDESSATATPHGIPILGGLNQLESAIATESAAQVILLGYDRPELARNLIARCQRHGARLLIVDDVAEQLRHPTVSVTDEGFHIIALREEPLENPFNQLLKRGIDLAIAIPVVVLILPPLTVLVWLLQRWSSPGPIWHLQARAGLQNRAFKIVKFRTMHVHDGPLAQQAAPGDARIYRGGEWLRRLSLDEFPQFLNVLGGEMSVVGPRPHLVEHNRQFAEQLANYHIRALIKPGITGLAQVRGFRGEARTAHDIAARLQSDLIYLENWSLSLELGILLRTFWQFLRPPRSAV
jgi:putative colanic acid biosynthesis UDP-glucose lipid carrier transferase